MIYIILNILKTLIVPIDNVTAFMVYLYKIKGGVYYV